MANDLRTIAELRRINRLLQATVVELTEARDFALASWERAVKRAARLSAELQQLRGTRVYPAMEKPDGT